MLVARVVVCMSDRIRKRAYSAPKHRDMFEEIFEKGVGFDTEDPSDIEIEYSEVEEPEHSEVVRSQFDESVPEQDDDFELTSIREKAYRPSEVSFEGNEGVEFGRSTESLTEKAKRLEKVNEQLEEEGIRRRYVMAETDAPDRAFVHEDSIGKYFYETPVSLRPSDVTKVVSEDSWFNIPENRRTLSTIVLLGKSYPWLVEDSKSDSAVDSLVELTLTSEIDDLESEDVFSKHRIDEVARLLKNR